MAATTHASKVRTWARENGLQVGERGRIHPTILRKYEAAHKVEPEAPVVDESSKVSAVSCGFCSFSNDHMRCPTVLDKRRNTICKCASTGHKQ